MRRRRQGKAASGKPHLNPVHPGAGAEPHIHWPPRQFAGPLGSFPQHMLELLPKQFGGVPEHAAASPVAASRAIASVPNSQIGHEMPVGWHDQTPFTHRSAAYLPPQHPMQMTGGTPSQIEASPELAS